MTNQCEQCGATVPSNAAVCPYCQAVTPFGRQQQQARAATETYKEQAQAQLEVHGQWQRQQQQRAALERSATYSVIAGAAGLVTCCLPVGAIAAIALAIKAQRHASQQGLAKPPRAWIGLIMGILGLVLCVVGWVYYSIDMSTKKESIVRLRSEAKKGAAKAKLTKKTACKLVKIEVLETSDYGIYDDADVDCRGILRVTGERAVLENVRVASAEPTKVTGCLERVDDRWVVAEVRKDERCFAAPSTTATATASASASGSVAPSGSVAAPAPSATH